MQIKCKQKKDKISFAVFCTIISQNLICCDAQAGNTIIIFKWPCDKFLMD